MLKKHFHLNSLNDASVIARGISKIEKTYVQFYTSVVILLFRLYLNTCSKKIYSFICYYKKEKEFCSKYFLFKVFCRFLQTARQKNV